jgi:hypothetical protein
MSEPHFKTCSCCGTVWADREAFMSDGTLDVNGYKADFERLGEGLFFITHRRAGCGSTLSIPAKEFFDLYTGVRYTERRTLTEECPRYCLNEKQLDRCLVSCECAFVREVLNVLRERLRAARAATGSSLEATSER